MGQIATPRTIELVLAVLETRCLLDLMCGEILGSKKPVEKHVLNCHPFGYTARAAHDQSLLSPDVVVHLYQKFAGEMARFGIPCGEGNLTSKRRSLSMLFSARHAADSREEITGYRLATEAHFEDRNGSALASASGLLHNVRHAASNREEIVRRGFALDDDYQQQNGVILASASGLLVSARKAIRTGNIQGRDVDVGAVAADPISMWSHQLLLDAAGKEGLHGIEAQERVAQQVNNASAEAGKRLLSKIAQERQKCGLSARSSPATKSLDLQYIQTNRWGPREVAQVLAKRRSMTTANRKHNASARAVTPRQRHGPTINLDALQVS